MNGIPTPPAGIQMIALDDGPLPDNHAANMREQIAQARRKSDPDLIEIAEAGAAWITEHLAADVGDIGMDTLRRCATSVLACYMPLLLRRLASCCGGEMPVRIYQEIALVQLSVDMALWEDGIEREGDLK